MHRESFVLQWRATSFGTAFKPVDYKEGERSNLVLSEFHHIVDAAFFIYFSMIFYFSGTGNSKWIANQLSKEQKEELVFIPDALKNEALEFSLQAGEKIGFVFPIYSWAPPEIVLNFIRQLSLKGYKRQYLFFVCSCGDDTCRDISVTCIAPTKTFNLAGLQTAAVYAENSILHHRMWRQLNTDEVAEPNAFAIQATIAAFQYGEEWLDELREYVEKNKQYVTEFLQEKIPLIHPVAGDATYLMWLDCRKITESGRQFVKFIRKTSGLYVSGGNQYGRGGEGFLRVNVATSKLVVEDGMQRLYESVDAWLKEEKISK